MTHTTFDRAILSIHYAHEITLGSPMSQTVDRARGAFEGPVEIVYEVDGGYVVQGASEAVFMGDDGEVALTDIYESLDETKTHDIMRGGLGIPRTRMPQIRSDLVPEFLAYLRENGVTVRKGRAAVGTLKPTQDKVSMEKAEALATSAPEAKLRLPVIVSSDRHILDGHHRWAALYMKGIDEQIGTYSVSVPIKKLLELARGFGKVGYKEQGEAIEDDETDEGINDRYILKAVFMTGGAGAGKSFISDIMFGGTGLKVVNSDEQLERAMKKAGLDLKKDMASLQVQAQGGLRAQAKATTNKRLDLYVKGRLGLIIDSTAANVASVQKKVKGLRALGYDVSMVFVNTSLETALARNQERPRTVPVQVATTDWKKVQGNLKTYRALFGSSNFREIKNDEVLSPREIVAKLTPQLTRAAMPLLNKPVQNPIGKQWVEDQRTQRAQQLAASIEGERTMLVEDLFLALGLLGSTVAGAVLSKLAIGAKRTVEKAIQLHKQGKTSAAERALLKLSADDRRQIEALLSPTGVKSIQRTNFRSHRSMKRQRNFMHEEALDEKGVGRTDLVRMLDARTKKLEWEGPLRQFAKDNADTPDVVKQVTRLRPGQSVKIGGGASTEFIIVREGIDEYDVETDRIPDLEGRWRRMVEGEVVHITDTEWDELSDRAPEGTRIRSNADDSITDCELYLARYAPIDEYTALGNFEVQQHRRDTPRESHWVGGNLKSAKAKAKELSKSDVGTAYVVNTAKVSPRTGRSKPVAAFSQGKSITPEQAAFGESYEEGEMSLVEIECLHMDDLADALQVAIQQNPSDVHLVGEHFGQLEAAVEDGNFEKAELIFEQIIKALPLDEATRMSTHARISRVRNARRGSTKSMQSGAKNRGQVRQENRKKRIARRSLPTSRMKAQRMSNVKRSLSIAREALDAGSRNRLEEAALYWTRSGGLADFGDDDDAGKAAAAQLHKGLLKLGFEYARRVPGGGRLGAMYQYRSGNFEVGCSQLVPPHTASVIGRGSKTYRTGVTATERSLVQDRDSFAGRNPANVVKKTLAWCASAVKTYTAESVEETILENPRFSVGRSADAFVALLKQKLDVPFVKVRISTITVPSEALLMVSLSLDPQNEWANRVYENSRFLKFSLSRDGRLHNFASWSRKANMRKQQYKTPEDAVKKINAFIHKAREIEESIDEGNFGRPSNWRGGMAKAGEAFQAKGSAKTKARLIATQLVRVGGGDTPAFLSNVAKLSKSMKALKYKGSPGEAYEVVYRGKVLGTLTSSGGGMFPWHGENKAGQRVDGVGYGSLHLGVTRMLSAALGDAWKGAEESLEESPLGRVKRFLRGSHYTATREVNLRRASAGTVAGALGITIKKGDDILVTGVQGNEVSFTHNGTKARMTKKAFSSFELVDESFKSQLKSKSLGNPGEQLWLVRYPNGGFAGTVRADDSKRAAHLADQAFGRRQRGKIGGRGKLTLIKERDALPSFRNRKYRMSLESLEEKAPPGFEGTVKAMKAKGMPKEKAFALAWSMYNKGNKSHRKDDGSPKDESVDDVLDENVGQTILQQLGGRRFIAMTGAKNFVNLNTKEYGRGGLAFKIGRNAKGVTHVRIVLTGADLYSIDYLAVRGTSEPKTKATSKGVYAEDLRADFTRKTGLATSLGTMGESTDEDTNAHGMEFNERQLLSMYDDEDEATKGTFEEWRAANFTQLDEMKEISLSSKQMAKAKRVVKKHYGMSRLPSEDEVMAEIRNVQRKHKQGSLDDRGEMLMAAFEITNGGAIRFESVDEATGIVLTVEHSKKNRGLYRMKISGSVGKIGIRGEVRPFHMGIEKEATLRIAEQLTTVNRSDGGGKEMPFGAKRKVIAAVHAKLQEIHDKHESVDEHDTQYKSVNDAAHYDPGYGKGSTEIWYMRDATQFTYGMGMDFLIRHESESVPTKATVASTHKLIGKIKQSSPERVFGMMQGERWSPDGEARTMLTKLGIHHTSMSVGDIIKTGTRVLFVDRNGFTPLS